MPPPQKLRRQVEGHQPLFSTLEADLGQASEVSERLVRGHSERDVDLERYRERVQQLLDRWQAVLAQIDLRQRELDHLGRQLRYFRESHGRLTRWLQEARQRQETIQAVPITHSGAVREQLLQEKVRLGHHWGAGWGSPDLALCQSACSPSCSYWGHFAAVVLSQGGGWLELWLLRSTGVTERGLFHGGCCGPVESAVHPPSFLAGWGPCVASAEQKSPAAPRPLVQGNLARCRLCQ